MSLEYSCTCSEGTKEQEKVRKKTDHSEFTHCEKGMKETQILTKIASTDWSDTSNLSNY